jgi:hypothetical protein
MVTALCHVFEEIFKDMKRGSTLDNVEEEMELLLGVENEDEDKGAEGKNGDRKSEAKTAHRMSWIYTESVKVKMSQTKRSLVSLLHHR